MRLFEAACDQCGWTERTGRRTTADKAARTHVCPPRAVDPAGHRCAACCRVVPLLVDDGPLCIRCDSLLLAS